MPAHRTRRHLDCRARRPEIGPIRVTAPTREEVLRKMDDEIHSWLEMCPCSGQTYRDVEIELVESV